MLLRILNTTLDDGEKRIRLGFVEVRTQSKLRDLEIQAGTKWVPRRFEYRRIQGTSGRWSIDRVVAIVGNVLIRAMTIWVEFDLNIVNGGMIWTRKIEFRVKYFWWPAW